MTPDRRTFVRSTVLGAAAAALPASADAEAIQPPAARGPAPQPPSRALDPAMLAALGDAVLPESLGAAGRAGAVAAFAAWLAAYAPVAEEMHGYGYAELTYTPPDPAPGWRAQLQALDLLARRSRRRGFAQLDLAGRRAVLDAAIRDGRNGTIPSSPLQADHVAVALLSHWAATSDAQDLAYGARIGAGQCRSLAETARRPLPIVGETRR
ncbi:MAG: gluconate 2-dehydrogenase subunit 3 family protein [Gemmatimonadota bacterium]